MTDLPANLRRTALQARCEVQRTLLAEQVSVIEARLQTTDSVLGAVRNFITKPTVLAGGLALLLSMGRSGWMSKLSRGVVLFTTLKRVYQMLKHK